MKPFRVLLYEDMHAAGKDILANKAELVFPRNLDEETLIQEVPDVQAIIIRANGQVSARIIDAAPSLRVIGRHGVGLDGIDLDAAKARGIPVVYTPQANTESVAEQCIGFMLAISKQIVRADSALREGRWNVRYEYIGNQLYGKTLGLVALGNIGRRVAEIAHRAFDMSILYYDVMNYPREEETLSAKRVSLEEVFACSDYVSVHLPLMAATRGLINRRLFELMKPSAYFINTARGGVVDEEALLWALSNNRIRGAGMDVYACEPLPDHHPLTRFENVVMTPHMSAHTDEALAAMSLVAEDVLAVLEGRTPRFRAV